MARVFQKYVAPNSEPIQIEHTEATVEEEEKKVDPPVDVSKTLRFSHNSVRMADFIQQSPRAKKAKAEPTAKEEEGEYDPDAELMMPMYWLMKGLRGMMQIAGNVK